MALTEAGRLWRQRNAAKLNAKNKEYRQRNRHLLAEKQRKYLAEHRELVLERKRKYRATNKAKINVSSTKSMTGHMLGAAGAMEALVCVQAIREGVVPPTINLTNADAASAATGLDFTPLKAVRRPVRAALSNSFGFGGTNGSLVFQRFQS